MYFWGSYSFQQPQISFKDDREPALKFPVRLPLAKLHLSDNNGPLSRPLSSEQEEKVPAAAVAGAAATASSCQVLSLSAAPKFALFVSTDGGLYGLGHNHATFQPLTRHSPRVLFSWKKIHFRGRTKPVEVSCGLHHVLVRSADGIVYSVGDNTFGQLGQSSGSARQQFVQPTQPKDADFMELALGGVTQIVASYNSSFAVTVEGAVYSWGYSGSGHLGHGNKGETVDPKTGLEVSMPVAAPKLISWFRDKRVKIVEIAVGKDHFVARSETDVYTCGEAMFGRLGVGETETRCVPSRVEFPYRHTPAKLMQIAAGEAHTIVLKQCPEMGSVVYIWGRYSSSEGQWTPVMQDNVPSNVTRVFGLAGTGSALLTSQGKLMVWGHSVGSCSSGRLAGQYKHSPGPIEVLDHTYVTHCAQSGQFWLVATDDAKSVPVRTTMDVATTSTTTTTEVEEGGDTTVAASPPSQSGGEPLWAPEDHLWDVVVPLDRRLDNTTSRLAIGSDRYDEAVLAFYTKYFADREAALGYIAGMPKPAPVAVVQQSLSKKGAHQLQVGDKIRLWMTDLYALGVVDAIVPVRGASVQRSLSQGGASSGSLTQPLTPPSHPITDATCKAEDAEEEKKPVKVRVEWARDDWYAEDIDLYSDDETVDEENPNRWQSLWFLEPPVDQSV